MLNDIYIGLEESSPTALVIIAVSLMMFVGFALTRLTKLVKLPDVTAYILAGILLGPYCFDLVPARVVNGTDFISDIALAFIAFGMGQFFRSEALKSNGLKSLLIAICESLLAAVPVFLIMLYVLKQSFVFSIIISALAASTAPTATMVIIRQTNSKGDFVNTLLQVVAFDNVVSLLAFGTAMSVADSSLNEAASVNASAVLMPLLVNGCVIAIGAVFGFLLKLLFRKRSNDNRLIVSIATLFAFCGLCALLDVSPLLGCLSMGTVYINATNDDKLFKQLNYFSPPILLLFFVRSGLNFRLDALFSPNGVSSGVTPLTIALVYFAVRIIGKYAGAFIGSATAKKENKIRNFLGLALLPQASVAIGLSALASRTLGSALGGTLQTVILASSILYEIVGPALTKLTLQRTGSYSDKIEDIVPVNPLDEENREKSEVELLIERIRKIRSELPEHTAVKPDEDAFTEGAEEYEASAYSRNKRFRNRR